MILYSVRNKQRVGYCRLRQTTSGDLEIAYMKVDPDWRGRGLATTLLNRAKAQAQKADVDLVAFLDPDGTGLTVSEEVDWLKRHGFKHRRWYDLSDTRITTFSQFVRHKPKNRPVMIWYVDLHRQT